MKPSAAWFEVSSFAAALMVGMLLVMWTQRPAAGCTLSREAPRALVLSRETDREHLATDLASADRIARRYVLATVSQAEQQTRYEECDATLVQEIATRHGLSLDQLRSGSSNAR